MLISSPPIMLSLSRLFAYDCSADCDAMFFTFTTDTIRRPRRDMDKGDSGFLFSAIAVIPADLSGFEQTQMKTFGTE